MAYAWKAHDLSKSAKAEPFPLRRSPPIDIHLTMPKDDYTSAAGGGLRLKGVSGSKITKHKKKRPRQPETEKRASSAKPDAEASESQDPIQTDEGKDKVLTKTSPASEDKIDNHERSKDRSEVRGKTEAELRHEERRRKRVYYFPPFLAMDGC